MNRRSSILISVGILIVFAAAALATGRPSIPIFEELPPGVASGFVAYERTGCVYVANLELAETLEIRCTETGRSEFEFYFTDDQLLQIGAFDEEEADLVNPANGEIVGQVEGSKRIDHRLPGREFPGWTVEDDELGALLEVDGKEYVLAGSPSAYEVRNVSVSDSGNWVIFTDNVGEVVLVGSEGGPWVVDTSLDDWGRLEWAPGS